MESWIRSTIATAKTDDKQTHLRLPEAAFLNGQAHGPRLSRRVLGADCRMKRPEQHCSMSPTGQCRSSPAKSAIRWERHPFKKLLGSRLRDFVPRRESKLSGFDFLRHHACQSFHCARCLFPRRFSPLLFEQAAFDTNFFGRLKLVLVVLDDLSHANRGAIETHAANAAGHTILSMTQALSYFLKHESPRQVSFGLRSLLQPLPYLFFDRLLFGHFPDLLDQRRVTGDGRCGACEFVRYITKNRITRTIATSAMKPDCFFFLERRCGTGSSSRTVIVVRTRFAIVACSRRCRSQATVRRSFADFCYEKRTGIYRQIVFGWNRTPNPHKFAHSSVA
jgi:hypothetical protein